MSQLGINKVTVLGCLGRTPDLKFTAEGKPVVKFSVAVNAKWKDSEGVAQERVEWIQVVSFGRLAEICGSYLQKGRHIFLEGRLQTRNWEDRDGNRRSTTEVVATELRFLPTSNKSGSYESPQQPATVAEEDPPF